MAQWIVGKLKQARMKEGGRGNERRCLSTPLLASRALVGSMVECDNGDEGVVYDNGCAYYRCAH